MGKQENNFFTSIHKLYNVAGKPVPETSPYAMNSEPVDSQNNAEKGSTGSQGNKLSYFTKLKLPQIYIIVFVNMTNLPDSIKSLFIFTIEYFVFRGTSLKHSVLASPRHKFGNKSKI